MSLSFRAPVAASVCSEHWITRLMSSITSPAVVDESITAEMPRPSSKRVLAADVNDSRSMDE
ncbi:hypothetical protein D3C76_1877380 [compost metagenome]